VLLSDYEGLPVAVLEGMAAGVVPVCLDTRSGIRDAIEHGVNGLIVKDRGSDFFSTVSELQNSPAKWQQLSLAARDTARRRYSIDECAHQWMGLFHDLGKQRTTRSSFRGHRLLRLPPSNPKFGTYGARLSLKKRFEWYVRSHARIHRMAKPIAALGRSVISSRRGAVL
jgi:hypothetical protein